MLLGFQFFFKRIKFVVWKIVLYFLILSSLENMVSLVFPKFCLERNYEFVSSKTDCRDMIFFYTRPKWVHEPRTRRMNRSKSSEGWRESPKKHSHCVSQRLCAAGDAISSEIIPSDRQKLFLTTKVHIYRKQLRSNISFKLDRAKEMKPPKHLSRNNMLYSRLTIPFIVIKF